MQQRGFQRAGLGVDRPAAPAAGIANQDVDAPPGVYDLLDHGLHRFFVGHVHLDPDGFAAAGVNFVDGAVAGHGFGLSLEFLVGPEIEVCDRDFCAKRREATGISPSEAASGTGDDGDFTVEFTHCCFL